MLAGKRAGRKGEGTRLQSLLIPRRRIGKGPGQPPQLACTGRLQDSATQVAWSRDRALEGEAALQQKPWRVPLAERALAGGGS